jgi:hypothetical protein
MANGLVNLPNNIYDGGAVKVDSSPFTNFYLQSQAKKRAKDEALDNYFRDFNKNINPAGMRTQDIEGGWLSKVNDWQSYYQQNKDLIEHPIKDNGKAYNQYLSMHNDLLADTEKSKNEAQKSTQYVVPIVSNPDKRTRLGTNGINAIHSHDLSIYDQNHQSLDPSVLDYSAKPFDIQSQQKLDKLATQGVKMSNVITNTTVDPQTRQTKTTYSYSYNPNDLQTIGNRYGTAYHSDDSFQGAIDQLALNQNEVQRLNGVYKSIFNKDIQDNADLAIAYGLDRTQQQRQEQKGTGFNPFTPYDYEQTREQYYDYTQSDINNSIDANVDRQIAQGKEVLNSGWASGMDTVPLSVDPGTLKALNVDNLLLSKDGQRIIPVWSQTNADGTTTRVQGTPMTIDDYKMAIGKRNVGAKYFEKKTKATPTQSSSTTETKKTKDPLGLF